MPDPTTHVVALSGGKDSTAMALQLAEVEPRDYRYVITPTGDELPEMVDHWKLLSKLLGKQLTVVSRESLNGLIRRQNALPNWRMRWCTRAIKIEPFIAYMADAAPAVAYVGLRADEESREGAVYGDVANVTQRWPLQEWGWGVRQVWDYLDSRGVTIPPRTDCARCFFQTLSEWYILWRDHPETYADAERQEAETGHTFRSPGRDTWPADLKSLRLRFETGDAPKGANQIGLFDARPGMCRACSL